MNASKRRLVTAAVAILIVIVSGLIIRNCMPKPEPIKINSGQTRSFGDIKWSVVSVMKVRSIEPSGANVTANGWFLVVDLYLTNQGKGKIEFDPESILLVDKDGKTYAPNQKATTAQVKAQANSEIKSIFNTAIEPGKKQRLAAAFEIGETATAFSLQILGAEYGSRQDLVIKLGF